MKAAVTRFPEISFRPSLLSNLGKVCLALGTLVLGLPVAHFISEGIDQNLTFEIWGVFCIVAALIFSKAAWMAFNQRLCLCDEYVSSYSGLLGPSLRTTRLLYEHVRGVEIEQSILQRCLNIGDLHVGSDVSKGEGEMVIKGVRKPDDIKDLLLERVRLTAHAKEPKLVTK
jgi:uncharacterized membrane protein YdbT with pleckstrin-like domain